MPKRKYEARVPGLRAELVQMQVALQRATFPVILVIAGDEASGKGEVVNVLNGWLDPRGVETIAFHEPTDEERERPSMWRYWRSLPPRGRLAIYPGGWHADALGEEPRSPRELVEFEHTLESLTHFEGLLANDGALIVKIWLRLSETEQRTRLRELESHPDTAWRVSPDDWKRHRDYQRLTSLAERMRRLTSKPAAPWQVIEASDPRGRNLAVAETLLQRFHLHARAAARPKPFGRPTGTKPLRPSGVRRLHALPLDQRLSEADYEAKRDKWLGRLNRAVREASEQGRSANSPS